MRRLITICLGCVLTTAAWGINIYFDENGNGWIPNYGHGGNLYELQYGGGGDITTTLYYILPVGYVVPGDLLIYDGSESLNDLSDILRFDDVLIGNQIDAVVYIYSDYDEPPSLADIGIPGPPYTKNKIEETLLPGIEGWIGVVYTPDRSSSPGFTGSDVTYTFISDVPEPATFCLLSLGGLALLRKHRA